MRRSDRSGIDAPDLRQWESRAIVDARRGSVDPDIPPAPPWLTPAILRLMLFGCITLFLLCMVFGPIASVTIMRFLDHR